ncbi:zinc finger BED domain-containing protein RICESLEEPER 2-like [Primulina eburnea]|uniref:zinc finger BED domain-containing protein RICESLEEPER 2-like n=1 Tax=Primulina eburnea TaxID=1245227 RepID=UPI003C6CB198
MCLTAHFIDKDWKLHKRIINFCPITSHKGEAISLAIENCLRGWGIDRVFTITVDNASSNDVAVYNFKKKMANWDSTILKGEYIHMRCVAHIINLIVVDGLQEINESVSRVRNAVKYVRQSPSRLIKFKEYVEIEKIESKNSLCLDVSTRWNSTFLMLNVTQKFERAFDRLDEQDVCFKLDLQYKEWSDIVDDDGGEWQESDDLDVYAMGMRMRKKFDKYWGEPEKVNKLLYIAVVLDPRHKLDFVEFMLAELYGNEKGAR